MLQEGDYRDPFQEAEQKERELHSRAKFRPAGAPPARPQGGNANGSAQPVLQLTQASPSPGPGVLLAHRKLKSWYSDLSIV